MAPAKRKVEAEKPDDSGSDEPPPLVEMPSRPQRQPPSSFEHFKGIARGVILSYIVMNAVFYVQFLLKPAHVHRSNSADQPLLIIREKIASSFDDLKQCCQQHPLTLPGERTNGTCGGWQVKFNVEGQDQLLAVPGFDCIKPFFDELKATESNSFILKLVMCGSVDGSYPDTAAVDVHQAGDFPLDSKEKFLAHQVNLLYVHVPPFIDGGSLDLYPYSEGDASSSAGKRRFSIPDERVHPEAGKLVTFRGDAHQRTMVVTSDVPRSEVWSLVLEQYRLPEDVYRKSVAWEVSQVANFGPV